MMCYCLIGDNMEFRHICDEKFITIIYRHDEHPDKALYTLHTHDKCELYCIMSGKGQFKIEGNSYPLSAGDILIMRPGEAHYIDVDPLCPYSRVFVHFDPSLFDSFDPERHLLEPFNSRERGKLNKYSSDEFQSDRYRSFVDTIRSRDKLTRINAVAKLLPLLDDICKAFGNKTVSVESETVIQKILKYINSNITEHISIDEICREFYISKSQLCRIFKTNTGSTIWEYITAKRLVLAQNYIRSGHAPSKIFANCGFGDYSTFYRAYKKRFGISPNEQSEYIHKNISDESI